jgi:hypothetical protein
VDSIPMLDSAAIDAVRQWSFRCRCHSCCGEIIRTRGGFSFIKRAVL